MRLHKTLALFVTGFLLSIVLPPSPFAMEPATGDVILEITGNIETINTERGSAEFDGQLLDQFKTTIISTKTPWTNGVVVFEGFLIRDLMQFLKAKGSVLHAIAYNEYSIDIPFEDFQKYDVILARKKNGKYMTLRDQGPFWVIYPWDDNPELVNEVYHSRSIWQLKTIEIE